MRRTAPVLRTDATNEAIGAMEKALSELRATRAEPNNWKWTIIALHNALQCCMVLALQSTHSLVVMQLPGKLREFEPEIRAAINNVQLVKDLPAKANATDPDQAHDAYLAHAEWLEVRHLSRSERRAYYQDTAQRQERLQRINNSRVWLLDAQLISFAELFQRLRQKKYTPYTPNPNRFPLPTTEMQREDVERLNQLRNEFIHFTPKSFTILNGGGMPRIVVSCTEIMLYLVEQGEVLWRIIPPDEEWEAVQRVPVQLRAMRDEARAISADYGTPI